MRIKNHFVARDYLFDKNYTVKFLNSLYYKEHKNKNRFLYLQLLAFLKETYKKSGTNLLLFGISSGKLELITIGVKVAGKVHNIPVPVGVNKQYSRFLKHLRASFRNKKNKSATSNLCSEFASLVTQTRGFVQTKNEALFDQAVDELSFAHFRWR